MKISNAHSRATRSPSWPDVKPLIFVVDNDVELPDSLQALSDRQGWNTERFSSAHEFLSRARQPVPCCLVVDVGMPGQTGLELQQRLIADGVNIPIIFVTDQGNIRTTVKAMKAGAVDFLTKPFAKDELSDAISHAIARSYQALDREQRTRDLQRRYHSLSRREREVMDLVVFGLLNKQVAHELGISEITVKAHRGRVMQKMVARSFVDLVMMAADLQLRLPSTVESLSNSNR